MRIRKFKEEDAEECSKIIESCIKKSKDLTKRAKENIRRETNPKELIKKSKIITYFVTEKNKKILGVGGLNKNEVIRMYVLPRYQNRKIGSCILKRIEKEAKKENIKKLFLYTHPEASRFYLKNKFEIVRKFKDKGMSVIYIEKKLK